MLGKEIQIETKPEKTREEKAKEVIEKLHGIIKDKEEDVEKAKKKLAEVLEKEVELITDKDLEHWEW